jgi:hypothetical protein
MKRLIFGGWNDLDEYGYWWDFYVYIKKLDD